MSITREQLLARFPGAFDALPADTVNAAIAEAGRRVNVSHFGDSADDALLYMSAHLTACARVSAGGIAGATVGNVSVTFAGAQAGSTQYSELYDGLLNSTTPGLAVLL